MKSSFAVGTTSGLIAGFFTGVILDGILNFILKSEIFIQDIYLYILGTIPSLGINAIFGAFFGLLAAIFFNRIPSNRILKGLVIGLIYCLFTALYPVYSFWAFDNSIWAYIFLVTSPIDKFIYGVLFAYLYKPSK